MLDHDWRFAELIARTWTGPGLREHYLADPRQVLAEAGIDLAPGAAAPMLPTAEDLEIVEDRFETLPEAASTKFCSCLCLVDDPQVGTGQPVPEALAA
jgi:putative thiazole/oxazole-modified microcin (TOMM)-like peptide